MSKKLTKKQRRKKIIHKRKLKKAAWENKCINKLIDGAGEILDNESTNKGDNDESSE